RTSEVATCMLLCRGSRCAVTARRPADTADRRRPLPHSRPGRSSRTARPTPALAVVSLPLRSGEAARLVDLVGGGDQSDVAEGLGEVAELLAVRRVDLLGEQAEVVRIAGELVEEPLRPLDLPRLSEAGDEPERADHERPFFAGETVGVEPRVVAVAEHELVLGQLVGNRLDR